MIKFAVAFLVLSYFSLAAECRLSIGELFPFGPQHGDSVIANKTYYDRQGAQLNFSRPFLFFGQEETSAYVTSLGVVSFDRYILKHTKCDEMLEPPSRLIAAFWAHGDISNIAGGAIFYREEMNPSMLRKAAQTIKQSNPEEWWGVNVQWMAIFTWFDVTYWWAGECTPFTEYEWTKPWPRNTFQAVLASDGSNSFVILNYQDINWTTATRICGLGNDCSGMAGSRGTAAKVGVDLGDGKLLSPVGSCSDDIVNIDDQSNVDLPGQFVVRVDGGAPLEDSLNLFSSCSQNSSLKIRPVFVESHGGMPITLKGPCLKPDDEYACIFDDLSRGNISVSGSFTLQYGNVPSVVCLVPFLHQSGRTAIYLSVNQELRYSGFLTITNTNYPRVIANFGDIKASTKPSKLAQDITFQWNPEDFIINNVNATLNISMLIYELTDGRDSMQRIWKRNATLATEIANNGSFVKKISTITLNSGKSLNTIPPATLLLFTLEPNYIKGVNRWVPPYMAPFGHRASARITAGYLNYPKDGKWDQPKKDCDEWNFAETKFTSPINLKKLMPCPPKLSLVRKDPNFEPDPFTESLNILGFLDAQQALAFFHPGATHSYKSRVPNSEGNGQQCTYRQDPDESDGVLLYGFPSGGTVDRVAPVSQNSSELHYEEDVKMFLACCKLANACDKYYYNRPSDDGTRYVAPTPSQCIGDPHLTTLDRLQYTFNGAGEFWMINSTAGFKLQARMEEFFANSGEATNASVFSSFAMQDKNGPIVQIEMSKNDAEKFNVVLVDGQILDFSDAALEKQCFDATSVCISALTDDLSEISVAFKAGYAFRFTTSQGAMSIFTTASEEHRGQLAGLLGNFDGDFSNDLTTPDGKQIDAGADLATIHRDFGLTWIVKSENDSLFTYALGKSYHSFARPDFTPNFDEPDLSLLPQEQQDLIRQICGTSRSCVYDLFATGFDQSFANETLTSEQTFNATVEIFEQEIKLCATPVALANGTFQTGNSTFFEGVEVNFVCLEGFELRGNSSASCLSDGNWTAPTPICHPLCSIIEFLNGTLNSTFDVANNYSKNGTEVYFSCDYAFELKGPSYVYCDDGVWSQELPSCVAMCIPPNAPTDGLIVTDLTGKSLLANGTHVDFVCNSGFRIDGSKQSTCVEGEWLPAVPTCEALPSTPAPPPSSSILAIVLPTVLIPITLVIVLSVAGGLISRRRKRRAQQTSEAPAVSTAETAI